RERRVELDQGKAVGIGERRQHARKSVAVRIRLHHRKHLCLGSAAPHHGKVGAQRCQVHLRMQGTGHGACGVRSWYKARAQGKAAKNYTQSRLWRWSPIITAPSHRRTMKQGFYTIMAAQFSSSLADNALLIAAIALLRESAEPAWMTPALKMSFVVSYVLLAPLVGAFADSMAKGRVMLITNAVKVVGCVLMLLAMHPLLAYAVVGFGAAAYSP